MRAQCGFFFNDRYIQELENDPTRGTLDNMIYKIAADRKVTLVYAAKDTDLNHANILRTWLLSR
ncbi:DUF488 family protein [Paenibacillus caui]|uniref:DUF488 family protein, N3 subclade n=1 Tax=Paenibacillus caui TaxID=2873927 RepID=UPI001CA98FFA